MIALMAAAFAALAAFVAVGALTGQFSYNQRRLAARAVTLQRHGPEGAATATGGSVSILKDDVLSGNVAVSSFLRRFAWVASRAAALERAALPLKVSEYVLVLFVSSLVVGALVWMVTSIPWIGLIFAVVTFVCIELWVKSRGKRRLALFDKQLPVALQVMATSLRSGFGIMEAVQTVGREMDDPLAGEFATIIDQARVGGSFEAGVSQMVERVGSNDLRIVARALEIHRKVGGDLASILDSVASTMREREDLRGHIVALTAQQRLGGMIVGILPVWVVGFFLVANPDFISPLWEENVGRVLLGLGACMEIVAMVAMRKIMSIEV